MEAKMKKQVSLKAKSKSKLAENKIRMLAFFIDELDDKTSDLYNLLNELNLIDYGKERKNYLYVVAETIIKFYALLEKLGKEDPMALKELVNKYNSIYREWLEVYKSDEDLRRSLKKSVHKVMEILKDMEKGKEENEEEESKMKEIREELKRVREKKRMLRKELRMRRKKKSGNCIKVEKVICGEKAKRYMKRKRKKWMKIKEKVAHLNIDGKYYSDIYYDVYDCVDYDCGCYDVYDTDNIDDTDNKEKKKKLLQTLGVALTGLGAILGAVSGSKSSSSGQTTPQADKDTEVTGADESDEKEKGKGKLFVYVGVGVGLILLSIVAIRLINKK